MAADPGGVFKGCDLDLSSRLQWVFLGVCAVAAVLGVLGVNGWL